MVYLNGACGNQSPRRVVTAQTFTEAERIGRALGQRMVEALQNHRQFTSNFPIGHASRTLELHGKSFPSWQEAGTNLARARAHYEQLKAGGASPSAVRTAECTVFGAEEVFTLAKAEQSGDAEALRQKYRFQEIQVLLLGGRLIAAWPGEFSLGSIWMSPRAIRFWSRSKQPGVATGLLLPGWGQFRFR